MVFWLTLKQINLCDFCRPGDIKSLKKISESHTYEETYDSELNTDEVFNFITEQMNHRSFRFMKILSEKIKLSNDEKNIEDKKLQNKSENKLARSEENVSSEKRNNSYFIKLYKLSDIFQFLSVVEIIIENNSDRKSNENNEKEIFSKKNDKTDIKNILDIDVNSCDNKMKNTQEKTTKTMISLKSISVSIFPAFFPLGFLLGFLFAFVPFSDSGVNQKYVKELIKSLNIATITKNSSEKKDVKKSNGENPISDMNEKSVTDEILFEDSQNFFLPPSKIFFFCFIVCPVFLSASVLLFYVPVKFS